MVWSFKQTVSIFQNHSWIPLCVGHLNKPQNIQISIILNFICINYFTGSTYFKLCQKKDIFSNFWAVILIFLLLLLKHMHTDEFLCSYLWSKCRQIHEKIWIYYSTMDAHKKGHSVLSFPFKTFAITHMNMKEVKQNFNTHTQTHTHTHSVWNKTWIEMTRDT